MYHISWSPRKGHLNGAGFHIELLPQWSEMVKSSGITETIVRNIIANMGSTWYYNHHGESSSIYNFGSIRFAYDEKWLIRSITIPGNACQLMKIVLYI